MLEVITALTDAITGYIFPNIALASINKIDAKTIRNPNPLYPCMKVG